ncbi:MAG: C40 family peptidase [Gaiellaceae bacterium]
MTYRPSGAPVATYGWETVIRVLKRQVPVSALAMLAALVAAGTASGDPSLGAKQAEAQQVIAQINQLDSSLERARNLYDSADFKLHTIEHSLTINRIALGAAKVNLRRSQANLEQRLIAIYTSRDDQTTLSVLLGAQSIDDLVNRIETVQSVSSQDIAVMKQVITFRHEVIVHRRVLAQARRAQKTLVRQRADAKNRIAAQLGRQQRLYSSIKGEIARLVAAQHARQLYLEHQVQARLAAQSQAASAQLSQNPNGIAGQSPDGFVPPPSQYSGVVAIAMRYLGTPYVWGGASPGGFDCSGLVMYAYAQLGISLPHYTGAQWNAGVHVSRGDLQPGDLVFFDGLGHEGIYIGNNEFIHAPHTGDVVKISSLSEAWYAATYDGAVRITG